MFYDLADHAVGMNQAETAVKVIPDNSDVMRNFGVVGDQGHVTDPHITGRLPELGNQALTQAVGMGFTAIVLFIVADLMTTIPKSHDQQADAVQSPNRPSTMPKGCPQVFPRRRCRVHQSSLVTSSTGVPLFGGMDCAFGVAKAASSPTGI